VEKSGKIPKETGPAVWQEIRIATASLDQ